MSNTYNEFLLDLREQAINFKFRSDCYPFLISCFAVYAVLSACMAGCKITPLCAWLSMRACMAPCIHAPRACTASCIRGSVWLHGSMWAHWCACVHTRLCVCMAPCVSGWRRKGASSYCGHMHKIQIFCVFLSKLNVVQLFHCGLSHFSDLKSYL